MKLTTAVLLLSLFVQPIQSQEIPKNRTWPNLANFSKGTAVRIQLLQPRTKLKGKLVISDDNGITITLRNGSTQTLAKTQIHKLELKAHIRQYAPLIGALAGAVTLGLIVAQPDWDFVPSAVVVMAGIGALIGFGLDMPVRYQIVYQSR